MPIVNPTPPIEPPPIPQRADRSTFSSRVDAGFTWFVTLISEVYSLAQNVYNNAVDAYNSSTAAAGSVTNSANSATAAANSATTALGAVATSGAIAWVSDAVYSTGNLRYSPINFATYRRKTDGAGNIDPSLDKTNWASANAISGGEIGQLVPYSIIVTGNVITSPNSGVYLKAGVQVSKATATAANYEVSQLEVMGICSPSSTTVPFAVSAMTFGGGLFCIVGSGGQIATSPDGITWTARTSGTVDNLKVVEYLNGQFVATGTAWLGASADGITWIAKTAPANTNLKTSIAYINGKYVVGTNGGSTSSIFNSADLVTWVGIGQQNVNVAYTWTYFSNAFYYSNGYGATVSYDLEGTPKIVDSTNLGPAYMATLNGKLFKFQGTGTAGRTSMDGTNWSNFTCTAVNGVPPSQGSSVAAYGNSVYVATTAAGMQSSADGVSWIPRTAATGIQGVTFLGGMFLTLGASSSTNIYTSTDGTTWTLRVPSSSMRVYSITYSGTTFVAVGSNTGSTSRSIASSADGITWTNRVLSPTSTLFNEVVFGNGKFVAIPNEVGSIFYSADGITWNSTFIASVVSAGVAWQHLRFLNGYFILSTQTQGMVFYSTDAITWNAATVTVPGVISNMTVNVSDYRGGKYFGLAANSSFSYADVVTDWYAFGIAYYPSTTISIKSNGSKLLSFGAIDTISNSHLMTSGDGVCWLSLKKPADLTADTTIPSDFNYANGKFVFTVGNKVVTSTNGLSWTSNAMSAATTAVYGIVYGAGTWWFTGNNGYAYTSTDLISFALRYGAGTTPLTTTPVKSVFGNSTFIGANIDTGTSAALTPDGVSGNIGTPISPTNPAGTTFYVKVK